jgi:chlorite dismutase
MAAHARSVRKWEGRVLQLVTGSAGLDDMELGVTLFAHNTADVKGMVRETRLDWAGARYAEFGEFFTGIQLPLGEVFRRVQL